MKITVNLDNLSKLKCEASPETCAEVETRYKEWVQSDYAGFRNVIDSCAVEHPAIEKIIELAQKHRIGSTGKEIKKFVLLGTGGSSLNAEVLIRALRSKFLKPQFYFMDNNDPTWFIEHFEHWKPEETFIFACSKSGSTLETWSQLLVTLDWLQNNLKSANAWKEHIIFCTDPESGDFRRFATAHDLTTLEVPRSVGGRFAAFTPLGLFPAAFAGQEIKEYLAGAQELAEEWEGKPLNENPAFRLAHALVSHPDHRNTIHLAYNAHMAAFNRWFCQLWAESLGKNGKGYTPYPAIGTTDQHSQIQLYMEGPRDKIVGFLYVDYHKTPMPIPTISGAKELTSAKVLEGRSMQELFEAEFLATRDALQENGIPNFTIRLEDLSERSIGSLLYFWQWTTVLAGAILDINPFNQPGVEKGKMLTKRYLNELS